MPGPAIPGRYRFIKMLGRGGSASVVRVLDQDTNREVALKLVGQRESGWLLREFETLRQIRHENLMRVFECSVSDTENSYYTMELMSADLGSEMGRPMSPERIRSIFRGILRGLAHLHSHGEIHGDLKPGNVLLGEGGVTKLADVGMGQGAGDLSGTPGYTAPEVWSGDPSTERSDIYSVGVIAYEALTGVHPFEARTIREVISGQIEGWVPSPSAHGISLPPDLERAVMRALERDPQLRQSCADELLEGMGIEPGAGEILGGRFTGRAEYLARVQEFAMTQAHESPTVLHLVGPGGIGKSAVLREAGAASSQLKAIAKTLGEPERDLPQIAGGSIPCGPGQAANALSAIADLIASRFHEQRVLFIEDPGTESGLVRSLGRYLWARGVELQERSQVKFIRTSEAPPEVLEPFEQVLQLEPLDRRGVGDLIKGILGRVELEGDFLENVFATSRGNPDAATSTVLELVERGAVTRREGVWKLGETQETVWESLRSIRSRRERDWDRLQEQDKDVLTLVALCRSGLATADLTSIVGESAGSSSVSRLKAFGLLTDAPGVVLPSSPEVQRMVHTPQNRQRCERMGALLLRNSGPHLTRVDRAALLIDGAPSEEAIREGLWLGQNLEQDRQFHLAVEALIKTRDAARSLGRLDSARAASLLAAEVLHRTAAYSRAYAILNEEQEWANASETDSVDASRTMLLGILSKARGDVAAAERHFSECSEAARLNNPGLWLQAEAELAELQWRHGGQPGREAASKRIEAVSLEYPRLREHRDQWASLKYQLGASLVVEGRREAAIPILSDALSLAQSDYWLMRINNALAAAHFYLGDMRAGIQAADAAWNFALKGHFDSFKPRVLMSRGTLRAGLGQYRESVEQNMLAASWGRRMGSLFDYEAALISAVADLFTLAEYEQAIAIARETREAALKVPNMRDVSKSLEMEGLTFLHLGDYASASRLFLEARSSLEGRGFDDLIPRLLWHEGRVCMEQGRFREAEEKLTEALRVLEKTKDYEDLPGVQVEMQVLFSRTGDQRLNPEELRGLLEDASRRELGTTRLRAAVAWGEVVVTHLKRPGEALGALMDELRFAETAGADEFVWRITFWISKVLRATGDVRGANARFASAVRIAREVASKLTPEHRSSYLATPHARLLLSERESSQAS